MSINNSDNADFQTHYEHSTPYPPTASYTYENCLSYPAQISIADQTILYSSAFTPSPTSSVEMSFFFNPASVQPGTIEHPQYHMNPSGLPHQYPISNMDRYYHHTLPANQFQAFISPNSREDLGHRKSLHISSQYPVGYTSLPGANLPNQPLNSPTIYNGSAFSQNLPTPAQVKAEPSHSLNNNIHTSNTPCTPMNQKFKAFSTPSTPAQPKTKPSTSSYKSSAVKADGTVKKFGVPQFTTPGVFVPRKRSTLLPNDPTIPVLKCQYCGQPFTRKNSLRRHELLHTGQKPFKCIPCDKGFSRQDIFKRHSESKRCRGAIQPEEIQSSYPLRMPGAMIMDMSDLHNCHPNYDMLPYHQ